MGETKRGRGRPEWLVCAATQVELETFWREGEAPSLERPGLLIWDEGFACAVTGIGIPFTFGRLLPLAQRLRPRRILNIGIAGAYPNSGLKIGDIVMGTMETYGDLGFELPDEPGFQSVVESALGAQMDVTGFGLLHAPEWISEPDGYTLHPGVVGCTVNACSGTERTGLLRERLFTSKFETMEGAAVAHVGFITRTPVCEVRAISNFAARRDMRPENIRLALTNLRHHLQKCRA